MEKKNSKKNSIQGRNSVKESMRYPKTNFLKRIDLWQVKQWGSK